MNELSGIQKFIRLFVSEATFLALQAESNTWRVKCPHCSSERSVWEMGGIRYKAAGSPSVYRTCPNCNQRSWHLVYKNK